MKNALLVGGLSAVALALFAVSLPGGEKTARPDDAAVERARDTVKMLDDVYKRIIVLVTDKYVHDEDDFAAGSAAVELFRQVSESDSQDVRLFDLTGDPYEPKNVAHTDFEKEGGKRIKKGAATFDEVFIDDGKPYLRVVTAVPVVHERCIMCHSHYGDVEDGEAIGALSYIVPIK